MMIEGARLLARTTKSDTNGFSTTFKPERCGTQLLGVCELNISFYFDTDDYQQPRVVLLYNLEYHIRFRRLMSGSKRNQT